MRSTLLLALVAVALMAAGCESSCNKSANPCDPCSPCAPKPCATPAPCAAPVPAPCDTPNCGPYPANALPGEAWCCVWVPPVSQTVSEQIEVCPQQCNKIWVPPVMGTRKIQVCVTPACSKQIPIPAEFQTVEECIEVCPARTEWQRIDCPPAEAAAGKQDCYALVTIPPVFEKRQKTVCTKPESCQTVETPAVMEERDEPYEVSCGYYRDETIPAKFETRTREVCVSEGRWEWRKNTSCAVPVPAATNPCTPAGK